MGFTSDWHQLVIENFITHLADASLLIATGRSALHVHHIDKIEKASQLILPTGSLPLPVYSAGYREYKNEPE